MALAFRWTDDGTMVPLRPKLADAEFVVGLIYLLEPVHERNMLQHKAYMAYVNEVWKNLQDDQAARFQSAEALRKYALCRTGFCYYSERPLDTHKDAVIAASLIADLDEFAIVEVTKNILRCWRPKSQSVKRRGSEKGMDNDEFKRSAKAVEEFLAGMIEVAPETLRLEAGKAA